MKPIDIKFLKAVGSKVNVIPLIAKADTLTKQELAVKKQEVPIDYCTSKIRVGSETFTGNRLSFMRTVTACP